MDCSTWTDNEWKCPEKSILGIKSLIPAVPDFPKPGIIFRDIMPIFQIPRAVTAVCDLMISYIETNHASVDAIVGLDARGFLIGPIIAIKLDVSVLFMIIYPMWLLY